MADAITLNIDTKGSIDEALQALRNVRGGAKQAIARALNKTAGTIKDTAAKEVSKAFVNIGEQSVKDGMRVSKATVSNASVTVTRKGPRFQARRFPIVENPSPGVRGSAAAAIRPRRSGGQMTLGAEGKLSKAFMVRNTHGDVTRGSGLYRRIGNHRDRLTLARGLSVPDMLSEYDVRSAVEERAAARLQLELDREIRTLLNKSEGAQS